MEEVWKYAVGYEGIYEVSNLGNVRKGDKMIKKTLSPKGYLNVSLVLNGKPVFKKVHRLVAFAFIPNPDNKPYINHINSIRNDNRIENIEWCTHKENMKHMVKTDPNKKRGGNNPKATKLINTTTGKVYLSMKEASEDIGMSTQLLWYHLNNKAKNKTETNLMYLTTPNN